MVLPQQELRNREEQLGYRCFPAQVVPIKYFEAAEHATGGGYVIGSRVIMWSNLMMVFQHLWFFVP
jgi:hypothetical protein